MIELFFIIMGMIGLICIFAFLSVFAVKILVYVGAFFGACVYLIGNLPARINRRLERKKRRKNLQDR